MKKLFKLIDNLPDNISRTKWHDYLFYYFELVIESEEASTWEPARRSSFLFTYKLIIQLFGALADIKEMYSMNTDLIGNLVYDGENLEILQIFTSNWGDGSELLEELKHYFKIIIQQNQTPVERSEFKYFETIIFNITTNRILQIIKDVFEIRESLNKIKAKK